MPLSPYQVLQAISCWIPAGNGGNVSSRVRVLEVEAARAFRTVPVLKVLPVALANWPSQCA